MSKAANEQWDRHYEWASRTRTVDPLDVYRDRQESRERWFLVGSWAALSAIVSAFYAILIR